MHAKINRCFCVCPFEGGCPLLGGSVKRGSTVVLSDHCSLPFIARCTHAVYMAFIIDKLRHYFSKTRSTQSPVVCNKTQIQGPVIRGGELNVSGAITVDV